MVPCTSTVISQSVAPRWSPSHFQTARIAGSIAWKVQNAGFEDFGDGTLVKGKAKINLPPDFATVIKTDSYHVFLAPYGRSNGLYVSKRNRQGFAVEEQGNGKSNLKFSFRIVGKRKGVKAERFVKYLWSNRLSCPSDRKKKEQPPRKPAIRRFSSGVLSTVAPR
jgi:hypothetical protein